MNLKLKKKLLSGEKTLGTWLTVSHIQVVEAMLSSAQFDWLTLDLEHSEIGFEHMPAIFNICEKYGVAPLVRLSGANVIEGRKALDLGAHGLIVPVVENAGAFAELCKHFEYPPKGKRGVCLSRMNNWGEDFDEYMKNFSPVIVPIVESTLGVKNAAEIAALECVDAVFIGPYDLSASLHKPADFENAEFKDHLHMVKKAAAAAKKPLGIHVVNPSAADLKRRCDEGFKFIAFGTDMIFIQHAVKAAGELYGR